MQDLLYLEIDFIGIVIVTILFFGRKHSAVQAQDQIAFDYLLIFSSVVLLTDGLTWYLDGKPGDVIFVFLSLASVLYNIFVPVIGFVWLLYCRCKVSSDQNIIKKRFAIYLFPAAVNCVMSVMSLYNGCIFSISADNVYSRGSMFFVNAVVNFIYLFYPAAICLYYGKKEKNIIKKNELYTMACFLLPIIICGIVQVMFYGLSLLWISLSIALLLIYLNSQAHLVSIDSLTGVNNRWQLARFLEQKSGNVSYGKTLYIFMIDIDRFKEINDKLGHATGDEALKVTAELLKSVCAQTHDFLARLGGDEFVVVSERDSVDEAAIVRDNILAAFEEFNAEPDRRFKIELSIGFAPLDQDKVFDSLSALLEDADSDMYAVKQKHHSMR